MGNSFNIYKKKCTYRRHILYRPDDYNNNYSCISTYSIITLCAFKLDMLAIRKIEIA